MDHDGARRLMAEAMEGRLSQDDERELALHLVGCQECKSVYEGLQHANPALTSIQLGEPTTAALDAAVHRATTVLRGEADPGPMGLTEEAPRLPDELDPNTVRIDTSGSTEAPFEGDYQPAGPMVATGPLSPPAGPLSPPEAHVRAIEAEPVVIEPPIEEQAPVIEDLPPLEPLTVEPLPGETTDIDQPPVIADVPMTPAPRSEIETLLEEDRSRFEPLPYEEEPDDGDRIGPGPWLLAIAVTVLLAVLAGYLISRGSPFGGGGGDLPSADEVRSRISRTFTDMKSLKTGFDIQKLSLYRVGREENSLTYSFSNGRWTGRIDYDRAEGYKQEFTLEVQQEVRQRVEAVQRTDETRSLVGGDDQTFTIEKNPPLGPPDGAFRPTLGLLEDSLASAAQLLVESEELEVLRITEREGRQMYEVRATVPATELSRADRIEAALDGTTYMPVIVKRTISRRNGRVLGPEDALADDDLDKAFGNNQRITTELIELENMQYDEIVLPGDLALDAPNGVEEQTRDYRFERVERPELGTKLDYEPLLPEDLPRDYEERTFASFTGDAGKWGPGNAYPAPESVFQSQYFNGRSTIVLTQRRMERRFTIDGSPLQRAGLPITVERVGDFSYGTSPEVPPHVFGFVGDVFVMASGYAPQDDLLAIVRSLDETPVDIPTPIATGSPGVTATPGTTPAASPVVTATP